MSTKRATPSQTTPLQHCALRVSSCCCLLWLLFSFLYKHTHTHSHTHSHICARFTHVQILNSIYPPLPSGSLPEEILLSAALQLVLLLAPALVALSARRVCLTFLRLLLPLLLLLFLCIIFHTPKYRISYRIVPYRTRPDKCNRAATLKQRASSALDIPPRLHSGPQSQAAVPSARLWRAPIDDDPTALPWPFALALLPLIVAAVVVVCGEKKNLKGRRQFGGM